MDNPEEKLKQLFPQNRLSVDEIRAVLAKEHKTSIPDDDPMMLMVTIFNAVLDKTEKSQKAMLEEIVQKFSDDLHKKLEPITSEALKGQIAVHLTRVREEGEIVYRIMLGFKKLGLSVAILTTLNIAASVANIYLITQ